ncbi:MAG: response regulator [Proteobacteria bacterium]|nr:response regulator [Pseudomonadota bacterium]
MTLSPGDAAAAMRGRHALDKLPGSVFQLLRTVEGHWSLPYAGRELPGLFLSSGAALAADAMVAADHIPPEDVERLKHHLRHSRETGQALQARFRVQPPGGDEIWLEAHAAPEMSFSGGTLWHGFLVDVTADQRIHRELRDLHKRWSLAARAAGIGVLEFDPHAAELSLDAISCQHHGIRAEQLTLPLAQWLEAVVPGDRLVAHAALNSTPLEGFAESLVLRLAATASAPERTLELILQAVPGEARLVGTCRDITQQLMLEALRRDKLAAEQADRSKGEFMSRVSHELRTPLNGILGFVQLMSLDRQHPLPPVHVRRLDVLRQSGTRLLELIDQLLDVSRLDTGALALRPGVVGIGALVDHGVAVVHAHARERGIDIVVQVPDDAPPLQADGHSLQRVLDALLSNAVKYNRTRGRIRIRFESAGHVGRLIVDDTGVGMSGEQLGRLFEPFNRLGAERTGVSGSGLGLVVARKLVRAMGGELEVQSLVGRGSRFQVSLPLAERRRRVSELPPLPSPSPPPPDALPSQWQGQGQGQRAVLYIEDDEVNTLLMEQVFLSQPAWRLTTAANGTDGLQAALEQQPAAILLDLHLPDMSGFDVLERIRADARLRGIPVVAVSADALPEQVRSALASGFDGYWTKPLDLVAIVRDLKRLLSRADEAGAEPDPI